MKANIKNLLLPALIAVLNLIPSGRVTAQTFTTLYSFTPTSPSNNNSDGAYPFGGLITNSSGTTLYGTVAYGGGSGNGTVFAVNTNGTGFTTLHSFTALNNNTNSDGASPQAGLVLVGNTLYGTAVYGGSSGVGTVFAVNTDGTGFTTLYSFTGSRDGSYPEAGLILTGNTLYGTAFSGGNSGNGTVFAVNTNGTGFRILHSFTGGRDGAYPYAVLILSSNTLYGTAAYGGIWGNGTVFAVNTDGKGFTTLHSFTATLGNDGIYGTNSDGGYPNGGLILSGNTLYGTGFAGGSSGVGTVFAVNTDGTGFTTLHNFTAAANNGSGYFTINSDGFYPQAGLILSGNTLYGEASQGGSSGWGTVFALNTDGTGFTNLHSFTYSDGENPHEGLILSGNTLYGTTVNGGISGNGTVFALNTDRTVFALNTNGTGFTALHSFTALNNNTNSDGANPYAGLIAAGNGKTRYGTTANGGSAGLGTVFAVNTDGTGFTNLHSFTGSDGANPWAGLVSSGNTLYGTTYHGGSSGDGTMFALNTDGTGFTTLHSFIGASDGAYPNAGLILTNNILYGTASREGSSGGGTVFAVNTDGTGFWTLHSFNGSDGADPVAGLILAGNTLYGTAAYGGVWGNGTVFKVNTDATGFMMLHSFQQTYPQGGGGGGGCNCPIGYDCLGGTCIYRGGGGGGGCPTCGHCAGFCGGG